MAQASWIPTRKWLATQVTAVAAFLVAWVDQGSWNKTLSIALIGLASQAIFGYLVPNADRSTGSDGTAASKAASVGVAAR
jgi:hypothetical protein